MTTCIFCYCSSVLGEWWERQLKYVFFFTLPSQRLPEGDEESLFMDIDIVYWNCSTGLTLGFPAKRPETWPCYWLIEITCWLATKLIKQNCLQCYQSFIRVRLYILSSLTGVIISYFNELTFLLAMRMLVMKSTEYACVSTYLIKLVGDLSWNGIAETKDEKSGGIHFCCDGL